MFRNGSTYEFHFIINKLAKEFEGQFEFLDENAEKLFFHYQLKGLDNGKTITYEKKVYW